MKRLLTGSNFKTILTILALCFFQVALLAQDSTSSSTQDNKNDYYYFNLVYPAMGMGCRRYAVLLVIIAMMRGNSSSTTERTTVIKSRPDSES